MGAKNIISGILLKKSCEIGKYVGSIINDSMIMCDGIIHTTTSILTKIVPRKTVPTKSNSKNACILLAFFINCHSIIDSCYYLLLLY